jgi:hypothetical protein
MTDYLNYLILIMGILKVISLNSISKTIRENNADVIGLTGS